MCNSNCRLDMRLNHPSYVKVIDLVDQTSSPWRTCSKEESMLTKHKANVIAILRSWDFLGKRGEDNKHV
jgi:hypothetical protein